ncbi:MAG: hypothetical protein A2145_05340 [candidate division Zixibacteria bacterium RBG_16_40_9]|nr:MAG: hypothetical protein A2145_05340 [candidate division Zixibacteria bacterium RBG_16_40_9]
MLFKHTSPEVEEKVEPASSTPFQSHRRVASWLFFLTILVAILILWGGIVRLSGSGLSIPEWPLINGSLLPPWSDSDWQKVYQSYRSQVTNLTDPQSSIDIPLSRFKVMFAIEYIHRFLASIVGIIFLAIFILTLKNSSVWRQTKGLLIPAAVLLLAQAIMGGVVVKEELQAELVAVHLGLAFLFFGLLLWAALKISRPQTSLAQKKSKLSTLAGITSLVVFIQIISGGLMAGTKAGLIFNSFPKMGKYWIPPWSALWSSIYETRFHNLIQNQITIQFLHRWWAILSVMVIMFLVFYSMKRQLSIRGRIALRVVGSLAIFQLLLGIGNLMMKAPLAMSLAHLATGLLLFGFLILITHEIKYSYAT